MNDIRVQEYGAYSYWPSSIEQAAEMAEKIMSRNGCGNIQQRQSDGTWKLTHRFERAAGLVEA